MLRVSLFLALLCAQAQEMSTYRIQRAPSRIVIDAKLDEPAWQSAPAVGDFIFNWFQSGDKEQTVAKILWDDENLYVSWRCQDRHISAYETKRHGPVSKDDCVEIFLSPNPAQVRNYYTFEINAIGTMLNRCRTSWWTGPPTWEPEGVEYRTTFHGLAKKDESSDDQEWIVEMAVPLRNFARDAANTPPRDGDEWRLNLQRLGGKTNAQASTWSPIPPPARSFHTPEAFGRVVFVSQAPASGSRRRGGGAFEPPPNLQDAAEGRELYNRSCTMCHGLDGAAGDRAPALGAQRRYLRRSGVDLFDAIKNGIKGTLMPATPLPDAGVWKVVAYIRSLRAVAADLQIAGNARNGETLFHGKGSCSQCHSIRGRGGILGPDLSNVGGERRFDDLKAALTQAKPVPPRGYQPVTLTTKDGQNIEGLVKNENNFSLQILGKDERLHLLLRDELATLEYGPVSIMPADYDKRLTRDELQDLLAFLSRQSAERSSR